MSQAVSRCQVVPHPDQQVMFAIDGEERLRWHFGDAPRPFFFPLRGPSGAALTRMGHPGAPNHDHHRSIWFAHHKVLGIDFWGDHSPARIRQTEWLVYEDGDEAGRMAVRLGWFDGHDPAPLLNQELIVSVRPGPQKETLVELQTSFRPQAETLELGQTNFGFLAVRMAASISEYFGGGQLTNDRGDKGEPQIFGRPASWMDYSGPVRSREQTAVEGITYFDHPSNPGFPARWHVREDGWMGASICRTQPIVIRRDAPLQLRYLLHAHRNALDTPRAAQVAQEFAERSTLRVIRSKKKHRQFELEVES